MADWFDSVSLDRPSVPNAGDRSFAPGQIQTLGDINTAGASMDPFAYTMGSLLTPWTKELPGLPSGGGGASAPDMKPFSYADFGYGGVNVGSLAAPAEYQKAADFTYGAFNAPKPFSFDAYQPAGKFEYAAYQAPDAFKGLTKEQLEADPSYQWRLAQGMDAIQNSAAASGLLRSTGTVKALNDYAQGAASQEYGNAYGRAFGEYQSAVDQALRAYQTNYGVAADAFNVNEANRLGAYQTNFGVASSNYDRNLAALLDAYKTNYGVASQNFDRNEGNRYNAAQLNAQNALQAFQANANATIGAGTLNYNIASGVYDRNRQNAQDAYNSAYQLAAAQAAAGASNSASDYNRQMQRYSTAYGIFKDNQDTQFNRLVTLASLGNPQGVANNLGNLATSRGNAQAAGTVGSANAWNGAVGGITNTATDLLSLYMAGRQPSATSTPTVHS